MTPNSIQFYSGSHTEVLRLSKDGITANPDVPVDEAARLVLAAMEWSIKVLVDKAVADEREACAKVADDHERQRCEAWAKVLTTGGEVPSASLSAVAAAIRARGQA